MAAQGEPKDTLPMRRNLMSSEAKVALGGEKLELMTVSLEEGS